MSSVVGVNANAFERHEDFAEENYMLRLETALAAKKQECAIKAAEGPCRSCDQLRAEVRVFRKKAQPAPVVPAVCRGCERLQRMNELLREEHKAKVIELEQGYVALMQANKQLAKERAAAKADAQELRRHLRDQLCETALNNRTSPPIQTPSAVPSHAPEDEILPERQLKSHPSKQEELRPGLPQQTTADHGPWASAAIALCDDLLQSIRHEEHDVGDEASPVAGPQEAKCSHDEGSQTARTIASLEGEVAAGVEAGVRSAILDGIQRMLDFPPPKEATHIKDDAASQSAEACVGVEHEGERWEGREATVEDVDLVLDRLRRQLEHRGSTVHAVVLELDRSDRGEIDAVGLHAALRRLGCPGTIQECEAVVAALDVGPDAVGHGKVRHATLLDALQVPRASHAIHAVKAETGSLGEPRRRVASAQRKTNRGGMARGDEARQLKPERAGDREEVAKMDTSDPPSDTEDQFSVPEPTAGNSVLSPVGKRATETRPGPVYNHMQNQAVIHIYSGHRAAETRNPREKGHSLGESYWAVRGSPSGLPTHAPSLQSPGVPAIPSEDHQVGIATQMLSLSSELLGHVDRGTGLPGDQAAAEREHMEGGSCGPEPASRLGDSNDIGSTRHAPQAALASSAGVTHEPREAEESRKVETRLRRPRPERSTAASRARSTRKAKPRPWEAKKSTPHVICIETSGEKAGKVPRLHQGHCVKSYAGLEQAQQAVDAPKAQHTRVETFANKDSNVPLKVLAHNGKSSIHLADTKERLQVLTLHAKS